MTEPFHLTAQAVYDANVKALAEGRLIAKSNPASGCVYNDGDGRGCAVGVALPERLYAFLLHAQDGIVGGLNCQMVEARSFRHLFSCEPTVVNMQIVHDKAVDNPWPGDEAYLAELRRAGGL